MYLEQAADDKQLLKEAKGGSSEAFGELYVRYAPGVFRFLFAHMDNRMDAEDLMEDVFLKAWKSLPKYREKGLPFRSYLHRIANNTLIDHYRSQPRIEQHSDLEKHSLQDPYPLPIDQVFSKFDHRELRQKLANLRDDYRTVLVARFISGLSPEETARMMGKSSGAVRVLQHRALSTLRKMLDGSINGHY
jgi:RNA polymerase sigma-70 factor, ECF subfamily